LDIVRRGYLSCGFFGRSTAPQGRVSMLEDKFESVIREAVRKTLTCVITREFFEAAVREAVTDILKPIALCPLMNIAINAHNAHPGDIYGCH
jgi:hypothetical protein